MKYIFAFCIIFCIEACHSNIKTEEIELLSPSRIKGEKFLFLKDVMKTEF